MTERTLRLPQFIYLVMNVDKYQFKKGEVVEAVRSKGDRGGWFTRENILKLEPGEAFEPDPGQKGSGAVEKYITDNYIGGE